MGLWGKSRTAESRPKFLPVDSNAAGSMGARENAIATDGGWALSPGLAASGNDNADAQPESYKQGIHSVVSFGSDRHGRRQHNGVSILLWVRVQPTCI